ncbi:hypothetical protein HMPREF0168_0275 [Bifidobacterium dentium ATCC 27679]|uniref:Uncharacterized protein n=1 Tax=Bifidobacterium dentium ATCC 27679 TaxID=871562 RepID=E0Q568_9BIFI|nr:hypothetical protein HMPREF0168_0275 [Bifidobacterium dentium ATCC 27679]
MSTFLNEVLSITAQESALDEKVTALSDLLNEVLSITAQELPSPRASPGVVRLLNEVLSITAQEWGMHAVEAALARSSMKS